MLENFSSNLVEHTQKIEEEVCVEKEKLLQNRGVFSDQSQHKSFHGGIIHVAQEEPQMSVRGLLGIKTVGKNSCRMMPKYGE